MAISVKLSDEIVLEARRYAQIYKRSVPKQIEYWSQLGKIVEENPDLPYNFIKKILEGLEDVKEGRVSEYIFDED